MHDQDFDRALIAAAFALAASSGWRAVSVAAAARSADLPLDRARRRFPSRGAILMRFGSIADQLALSEVSDQGPPRERLFDVVMRRFDALQQHRDGVLALLKALPTDPASALLLAVATRSSMAWMLEGAGLSATGVRGRIATQGLIGVWLYTLRAWSTDDSPDLSGTMAALDRALARVEQVAVLLNNPDGSVEQGPKPFPEPDTAAFISDYSEPPGDAVLNGADVAHPAADSPAAAPGDFGNKVSGPDVEGAGMVTLN